MQVPMRIGEGPMAVCPPDAEAVSDATLSPLAKNCKILSRGCMDNRAMRVYKVCC